LLLHVILFSPGSSNIETLLVAASLVLCALIHCLRCEL
jgi:hypothetical protein